MNIGYSFFLTFFAGFSTLLGTLLVFIKFKNTKKVILSSLSFSSAVMLTISIFDLMPESLNLFNLNYNLFITILLFLIFLIIGMLIIIFINRVVPQDNNLYKIGIISMIGIILHNIPEGILTFITSSYNKSLGISMALAITMHNIPEGIIISIPIYYSTNSKFKALFYIEGPIIAALQAIGRAKDSFYSTLFGIIIKTILMIILSFLHIGIYTLIIPTIINVLYVTLFNAYKLKKVFK